MNNLIWLSDTAKWQNLEHITVALKKHLQDAEIERRRTVLTGDLANNCSGGPLASLSSSMLCNAEAKAGNPQGSYELSLGKLDKEMTDLALLTEAYFTARSKMVSDEYVDHLKKERLEKFALFLPSPSFTFEEEVEQLL
jgi:hypothetical protein